jgi:hypothetical protein
VLFLCGAQESDLLIRDPSHSDFFLATETAALQTVRAWLAYRHLLLSVVTLRHPLESWLRLGAAG